MAMSTISCKSASHSFDCNHVDIRGDDCPSADRLKCKVCLSEEIETVFLPCGHAVCCINCSYSIRKCVVCRTKLVAGVRIWTVECKCVDTERKLLRSHSLPNISSHHINFKVPRMEEHCPFRYRLLCKICFTEDLQVLCLNCYQGFACVKCSVLIKKCFCKCSDSEFIRIYV